MQYRFAVNFGTLSTSRPIRLTMSGCFCKNKSAKYFRSTISLKTWIVMTFILLIPAVGHFILPPSKVRQYFLISNLFIPASILLNFNLSVLLSVCFLLDSVSLSFNSVALFLIQSLSN